MRSYVDEALDLFCGAGGTSTGLLEAYDEMGRQVSLTAVNHWTTAINTHSLNHRNVRHICEPVENLHPRSLVRRRLRILCASCECIYHSIARGGGPCNEQSRSQPWQIIRWCTDVDVENVIMENVKEFLDWGPLLAKGIRWRGRYYKKDRPDPRFKGVYFNAFITALRNLGYNVEWRIQCCADFGDATSRRRFMLIARKGKPVVWPEPSHGEGTRRPWRGAEEIIDWTIQGINFFDRKSLGLPPLCENTVERIIAGLEKFGGPNARPFIAILRGTKLRQIKRSISSITEPLPSITAGGGHMMLVEPFLTQYHGNHKSKKDGTRRNHSLKKPLPNQETSNRYALVEPFVAPLTHHGGHARRCKSTKEPLQTVTGARRGELALIEPLVIGQQSPAAARPAKQPLPTVASKGAIQLVEPFIVPPEGYYRGNTAKKLKEPLVTVTGSRGRAIQLVEPLIIGADGPARAGEAQSTRKPLRTVLTRRTKMLAEPILVQTDQQSSNGSCAQTTKKPIRTVVTKQNMLLVEPIIVKYYGHGVCKSTRDPLDTITTRDRFLLVECKTGRTIGEMQLRTRMLQPPELAAAHSFPRNYIFDGNKEDQTKQIGNSVPVKMAKAHVLAILQDELRRSKS